MGRFPKELAFVGILIASLSLAPCVVLLFDALKYSLTTGYSPVAGTWLVAFRVGLNTLFISLWVTAVTLLIGFTLAHFIDRLKGFALSAAIVVVLIPLFVNQVARNAAWMNLLDSSGVINSLLYQTGFLSDPLELIYNRLGVIIVLVHGFTPIATLSFLAAIKNIDREVLETARACGAPPFNVFRRIYLPLISPAILASGFLVFVLTLGYFITPAMLGGRKGIMIAKLLEQLLNRIDDPLTAYILAVVLAAIALPASFFLTRNFYRLYGS